MLGIIRPPRKEFFGIHKYGIKWIFQLRVGLSSLRSHKYNHHFQDTPSPKCLCNDNNDETTTHFLLECPKFDLQREEIITLLHDILFMHDIENLTPAEKTHILLYGHDNLLCKENQMILKSTIKFIGKPGRFTENDD